MTLSLIWAQASDGVIGRDGVMPWHVPEDMARFKNLTVGHPVIMGRRTWESIEPRFRPLVDRRNVVVTRQADFEAAGAEVVLSVEAALASVSDAPAWVIGGGQIYAATIDLATHLEVTELGGSWPGDTLAPAIDTSWTLTAQTEWSTSRTGAEYRFLTYERGSL
jgi:dihydrofolate reductase